MRNANLLVVFCALAAGALLSLISAVLAAQAIESRAANEIRAALAKEGITWVEVETDGLRATLTGTAPNEAMRFRAVSVTGTVVDASRVIDALDVPPSNAFVAPNYSLELLRNANGVSMIGLIPNGDDRESIAIAATKAAGTGDIADMMDTARYPVPETWPTALKLGIEAMELLPRSKISVQPGRVAVTAAADSAKQKADFEKRLTRKASDGIELTLDISAPRPVIAPFTLRFVKDATGARFDACSAHTEDGREKILLAAQEAGQTGAVNCTLGLGVPSPQWPDAVAAGIGAISTLGSGTLTFSDADVSLVADEGTSQALFDRVTGELEADLPEVFTLHSVLRQLETNGPQEDAPIEFLATRSPEGLVQLRGRITSDLSRAATESYAFARFGRQNVYAAMVIDETLPQGWPSRTLTGLDALSLLTNGSLLVQPDFVNLRGTTSDPDAQANIARMFAEKLGDAQNFKIDVTYIEPPEEDDPSLSAEACLDMVNTTQTDGKIAFAPGSDTIEGGSLKIVDAIAEILRECPDVQMEIGGHTDSQGRETMNTQLSQQRADAVMMALISRRVLTTNLTSVGYGESRPVADNGTEEGREANRRIEFTLPPKPDEADGEQPEPLEELATQSDQQTEADNEQN